MSLKKKENIDDKLDEKINKIEDEIEKNDIIKKDQNKNEYDKEEANKERNEEECNAEAKELDNEEKTKLDNLNKFFKDLRLKSLSQVIEEINEVALICNNRSDFQVCDILESQDLKGVANMIKKHCKNIIIMTGAGISTSAGIPDYRSFGNGIYNKLKHLKNPEWAFQSTYFKENPELFFSLFKAIFLEKEYEPTIAHKFIKFLEYKNKLLRLYTQNIDNLDFKTGLDISKIISAHGTIASGKCLECKHEYDFDYIKNIMKKESDDEKLIIPRCNNCDKKPYNIIKPDVVFYGDRLPFKFFDSQDEDFDECDLLIIIGTSLKVQPFCGLINKVSHKVPRLVINKEIPDIFKKNTILSNKKSIKRDVFLEGSADEICTKLIEEIGWKEEFEKFFSTKD